MEKSIRRFTRIGCAVVLGMVFCHYQLARAGWSVSVGAIDGKGTVTVKVTSHTGPTNKITTPYLANPSAAINQQSNNIVFSTRGALPSGADPRTYVQVQAFASFRTSIQSTNFASDIGDSENTDLLQYIIPRSACAGSDVEIVPINVGPNSITFQYKAKLSDEGSAVLLRVVDTVTGQQKYVALLVGPYDNTVPSNNCEGTITVNGNVNQLNMLLDGTTSTLPFSITCPPDDIVLGCGSALPTNYAPAAVTSSLPYTLTYDPLPNQLVFGVTNIVTVTARDINGCTVDCQFKVYRQAINFDGFDSPISGADATGGSCGAPLRTFRLGNVVPVKFAMSCNGVPITSGVPPRIRIQNCNGSSPYLGLFEVFNSEWHFNIDSTVIGTAGKYTITAILPDASEHSVVLQYKR